MNYDCALQVSLKTFLWFLRYFASKVCKQAKPVLLNHLVEELNSFLQWSYVTIKVKQLHPL